MRAKFINEIKRADAPGLSKIGVGHIATLKVWNTIKSYWPDEARRIKPFDKYNWANLEDVREIILKEFGVDSKDLGFVRLKTQFKGRNYNDMIECLRYLRDDIIGDDGNNNDNVKKVHIREGSEKHDLTPGQETEWREIDLYIETELKVCELYSTIHNKDPYFWHNDIYLYFIRYK